MYNPMHHFVQRHDKHRISNQSDQGNSTCLDCDQGNSWRFCVCGFVRDMFGRQIPCTFLYSLRWPFLATFHFLMTSEPLKRSGTPLLKSSMCSPLISSRSYTMTRAVHSTLKVTRAAEYGPTLKMHIAAYAYHVFATPVLSSWQLRPSERLLRTRRRADASMDGRFAHFLICSRLHLSQTKDGHAFLKAPSPPRPSMSPFLHVPN